MPTVQPLPTALEERLAALEGIATTDFDRRDWWWMVLLGVLLPIGLVTVGWVLGAGPAP